MFWRDHWHACENRVLTFADTNVISTPPGTSGLLAFGLESDK